ncbi:hypothetical protein [Clostridium ljungdahlii]|uniref:hypothetical protein n=1 Tax=Clostridium ljungdahlii TaxID=1538 RepID=UPI000B291065|nr:hypothetical protein [Clostridium ljungdahlii]
MTSKKILKYLETLKIPSKYISAIRRCEEFFDKKGCILDKNDSKNDIDLNSLIEKECFDNKYYIFYLTIIF